MCRTVTEPGRHSRLECMTGLFETTVNAPLQRRALRGNRSPTMRRTEALGSLMSQDGASTNASGNIRMVQNHCAACHLHRSEPAATPAGRTTPRAEWPLLLTRHR